MEFKKETFSEEQWTLIEERFRDATAKGTLRDYVIKFLNVSNTKFLFHADFLKFKIFISVDEIKEAIEALTALEEVKKDYVSSSQSRDSLVLLSKKCNENLYRLMGPVSKLEIYKGTNHSLLKDQKVHLEEKTKAKLASLPYDDLPPDIKAQSRKAQPLSRTLLDSVFVLDQEYITSIAEVDKIKAIINGLTNSFQFFTSLHFEIKDEIKRTFQEEIREKS